MKVAGSLLGGRCPASVAMEVQADVCMEADRDISQRDSNTVKDSKANTCGLYLGGQ